jgi:hypothetical protein
VSFANLGTADQIGLIVGVVFTLSVFSYLLGDNALFRLAIHIFVGAAAGYVAIITWNNVIWPKLLLPVTEIRGLSIGTLLVFVPLLLSVMLLAKVFPRLSMIGSPVMAYLVGIGAATAIGGAVIGTLFPQVLATINIYEYQAITSQSQNTWSILINGSFILVGTLSTLIYFHYGVRTKVGQPPKRAAWINGIASAGSLFIAISFGALMAGVLIAALTALVDRWNFMVSLVMSVIGN